MTAWTDLDARWPKAPELLWRAAVRPSTWAGLLADDAYRPLRTDVALRADLTPTPARRAGVLAPHVPDRAVVGRRSAAWVHLGGAPPTRVELLVAPRARRVEQTRERLSHEAVLAADEVVELAGVRVTSATRTMADLAVLADPDVPLLARLAAAGADPRTARRRLHGRPGARTARVVLDGLGAQVLRLG